MIDFSQKRFSRALERQLQFQTEKAKDLARLEVDHTKAFVSNANYVKEQVGPHLDFNDDTEILEVGSGAHGHIFFLDQGVRVGVDPLADHYRELFPRWQNEANTVTAFGEALPFDDNSFDLVISDNVVDHARDPFKIVNEMSRVTKNGGVIYFTVHIHHPIYSLLSNIYGMCFPLFRFFEITAFADHTVHLKKSDVLSWFRKTGLTVISSKDNRAQQSQQLSQGKSKTVREWLKHAFYKNVTLEVLATKG